MNVENTAWVRGYCVCAATIGIGRIFVRAADHSWDAALTTWPLALMTVVTAVRFGSYAVDCYREWSQAKPQKEPPKEETA